jgi:hypothetical protein
MSGLGIGRVKTAFAETAKNPGPAWSQAAQRPGPDAVKDPCQIMGHARTKRIILVATFGIS